MTDAALNPVPAKKAKYFSWLTSPHLKKVIAALEAKEPSCARFVGGAVRDSLFGEAPKDFDIATTLEPKCVIEALRAAGLRSAPTGIDHGTITAIVDHHGVEVTTLRADVSTDGRRATVRFTQDWATDATRRDFTINAIYLTLDGKLFDPVGGVADATAGRVAYIGEAQARIREDFLRILRFFRFSARFAGGFDETGLAACAALKDGIANLSGERIGAEMMAILRLTRAEFALDAMQQSGVLGAVWPGKPDLNAVAALKKNSPDAAAPVVLAALFGADADKIGSRLRLSNAEKAIRRNALSGASLITPDLSTPKARALIYRLGKDVFADGAAVAVATGAISTVDYERLTALANEWLVPVFPVTGKDVLAAGVQEGPDIARVLAAVEQEWIEDGYPDAVRARKFLADHINQMK